MRNMSLLFLCLLFTTGLLNAQEPAKIERVFQLGELEQGYEALNQAYTLSLLEVHGNDMRMALNKWLDMLQGMERYAEETDFQLKGIKVWMHVFWNKEGTIDYLGYFLQPESRNVEEEQLESFFRKFADNYQLPVDTDRKFTHYGGASFPTLGEKVDN
ncbi:MAG: hypothetical protein R3350_09115 [Saprospiraceae bacterium]|nr:hypothetical protein [Saprospiraceae bacterium]